MPTVYVAGPVLRSEPSGEIKSFIASVYGTIADAVGQLQLSLPLSDPTLEHLRPDDFYRAIYGRIHRAEFVVSVLVPFDISGPIESAIASMLNKKQVIVAMRPGDVPRMMRGLPGVLGIYSLDTLSQALEVIRSI